MGSDRPLGPVSEEVGDAVKAASSIVRLQWESVAHEDESGEAAELHKAPMSHPEAHGEIRHDS